MIKTRLKLLLYLSTNCIEINTCQLMSWLAYSAAYVWKGSNSKSNKIGNVHMYHMPCGRNHKSGMPKLIFHYSTSILKICTATVRGGRDISDILLTVVGAVERIKKCIYNMGSKLDSFLRKRCFLFCFVHVASYCLYR